MLPNTVATAAAFEEERVQEVVLGRFTHCTIQTFDSLDGIRTKFDDEYRDIQIRDRKLVLM